MMQIKLTSARTAPRQSGFTLIEVMISTVVLTIGLVSVLGALCVAVAANQTAQQDMIARQLASEAMESVYTARNDSEMDWAGVNNVSNGGIFVDGITQVMCSGPDGILGTADDAACLLPSGATCPNGGVQCLDEPGPDGILGTADDVILSLNNYTRQIQITPLLDSSGNVLPALRNVTITITYSVPQSSVAKTYVITEYVSAYH
jgi:prepilin-type N-terminal cleavage/methylation domain-containing protein